MQDFQLEKHQKRLARDVGGLEGIEGQRKWNSDNG